MLYGANRCSTESASVRSGSRRSRRSRRHPRIAYGVRIGGDATSLSLQANKMLRARIKSFRQCLTPLPWGRIIKMFSERRRRFLLKRLFSNSPIRFFDFVFDPKKIFLTSSGFLSLSIKKSQI